MALRQTYFPAKKRPEDKEITALLTRLGSKWRAPGTRHAFFVALYCHEDIVIVAVRLQTQYNHVRMWISVVQSVSMMFWIKVYS